MARAGSILASFGSVGLVAVLFAGALDGQGLVPSKDIPRLEAQLQRDSNDAQLHYQLGVAYWSRKRYDDAERSFRTAVSIERRFAAAYLALGYLPYARRRQLFNEQAQGKVPPEWREVLDEADRMRRLAFLINPLVDLQIMGAVIPTEDRIISFGREVIILSDPLSAFVRGNYRSAFAIFDSWVVECIERADSVPDGLLWFRGLAAAHIWQHHDTAIRDFEALLDRGLKAETTAVRRSPIPMRTNDYRYILALLNYRARRYDQAIALYKESLGSDLGLFMAHVQMGRMYEEQQQWSDAIEHFRSAVATNPDDPSLLLDLGVVLREAGDLGESETVLHEAMLANPRDSRIPFHLGITLEQAGKKPDAHESFTRFLTIAPSRYEREITYVKQRLVAQEP